ncbi:MAG: c-type cytochrome [Chitinophagaceae bacterium]|nr:c-type cytochrome [Chitinophagaceae bacterium]
MKRLSVYSLIILVGGIFIFSRCNSGQAGKGKEASDSTTTPAAVAFGGFESQVAWGKHLVAIGGCNDCHTPKKMGPNGPENNMDLELSGNPSQVPPADVNRKEIESKGLLVGNSTFTSFVGPWGISYAANITSDSTTGIGTWTFEQFKRVFKTGKFGGAPQGRNVLPPMPWQGIGQMTDPELEAVFAYLKSTKPVHNVVPSPQPPVLGVKK